MIRKMLFILSLSALLTACAEDSSSSSDYKTSSAVTTVTTAKAESHSDESKTNEVQRLKVISYKDEKLTVERNGKEEVYDLKRNELDETATPLSLTLPERVINTPDEEIYADILFSADGKRIISCDVIKQNLTRYSYEEMSGLALPAAEDWDKLEVSISRVKGSVFEISNDRETLTVDLNELDNLFKGKYPDHTDRGLFDGYKFADGKFLLTELLYYYRDNTENGGTVPEYTRFLATEYYFFFGTVQSVSDDRAKVLLTDGKTLCDVPTYYNDCEVKAEQEVMLTLDADKTLFGSGEKYKADYAVFWTKSDVYNQSGKNFGELAYAKMSTTTAGQLDYTLVDQ